MKAETMTNGRTVTFKGNPLHLTGNEVTVGDKAPDFVTVSTELKPVRLSDFAGQIVVLVAVPSLDTPVCDLESQKFNQQAASMGEDVKVLVISMDLPFAQKRWCGAHDIKNIVTLSDYQERSFANNYGILIKELHLLARSVFIVDRDGTLQYREVVPEITEEPTYEQVLKTIEKLVAKQGV